MGHDPHFDFGKRFSNQRQSQRRCGQRTKPNERRVIIGHRSRRSRRKKKTDHVRPTDEEDNAKRKTNDVRGVHRSLAMSRPRNRIGRRPSWLHFGRSDCLARGPDENLHLLVHFFPLPKKKQNKIGPKIKSWRIAPCPFPLVVGESFFSLSSYTSSSYTSSSSSSSSICFADQSTRLRKKAPTRRLIFLASILAELVLFTEFAFCFFVFLFLNLFLNSR